MGTHTVNIAFWDGPYFKPIQTCPLEIKQELKAPPLAPAPILTPPSPAVEDVSDRDEAMSEEDQDAISIVAFWDGDSLEQQETEAQEVTQETGPSSEVASETGVTLPSSLV
ncbi:hypothetical protein EOD39_2461 [Acipenser ruthenus]|uniref:Uncharacterized protein n=1 Tax=Acipenser ruthenus TaxID=7906 RepID=A0A444U1E4_ACIRT|nr:hypothetical protein EOD39_2461 [Acipenser ruthenus]